MKSAQEIIDQIEVHRKKIASENSKISDLRHKLNEFQEEWIEPKDTSNFPYLMVWEKEGHRFKFHLLSDDRDKETFVVWAATCCFMEYLVRWTYIKKEKRWQTDVLNERTKGGWMKLEEWEDFSKDHYIPNHPPKQWIS